jgi:hypothetical protein
MPNLLYFSYRPLSSVHWSTKICQTPGGRLLDISSPRQPTSPCRVLSPPSTPPSHEHAGAVPMPLLVPILLATFAAPSRQSPDTTSWQRTALSFLRHTQTPHSPTQAPTPSLVNPRLTTGCSSLPTPPRTDGIRRGLLAVDRTLADFLSPYIWFP